MQKKNGPHTWTYLDIPGAGSVSYGHSEAAKHHCQNQKVPFIFSNTYPSPGVLRNSIRKNSRRGIRILKKLRVLFTHGPRRWNHGSTDGLFLLLLLLLLHTTKFLFLLGTANTNFQTGLTFQATPVTPISSCSFSFYFLECFCLEKCPLLSGELSTDSRKSSDSYCSSVQSSPGLDI